MSSSRLLVGVDLEGHVEHLPDNVAIACIHLPGGYKVAVKIRGEATDDQVLDLGLQTVNKNLERLLALAPASMRRAYCLALGGGFDS